MTKKVKVYIELAVFKNKTGQELEKIKKSCKSIFRDELKITV